MARLLSVVLAAALALSAGCASVVKAPIKDEQLLMDVEGTRSLSKSGLTVEVTPIDVRNAHEVSDFRITLPLRLCDARKTAGMSFGEANPNANNVFPSQQGVLGIAFKVRIINGTDHTISLDKATIQLEDGSGKSWKPVRTVTDTVTYKYLSTAASQNPGLAQELQKVAMATLSTPGPDTRILPGRRFDGLLVFNAFSISPKTYPKAPLTVLFYDVVTATDPAGNPTKREHFEFKIKSRATELYRTLKSGSIEWARVPPTACQSAK